MKIGSGVALGMIAAGLASHAMAEDRLAITVRPSGFEAEAPPQDRLERMMRRFDRTEHAFRHICVACGASQGSGDLVAPFNPMATLAAKNTGRNPEARSASSDGVPSAGDPPAAGEPSSR